MFRRWRDRAPATVAVTVDRRLVHVATGASAAAAVLAAGFRSIRATPISGSERPPYCMMRICFECLAEIDGIPNRQSCLVEVQAGMQIRRQIGARRIDPTT
jgi:hypothetical protein